MELFAIALVVFGFALLVHSLENSGRGCDRSQPRAGVSFLMFIFALLSRDDD
jgi:hypothetical protein